MEKNMDYLMTTKCSSELYHHGILGQKWGVRRFQNKDGTLTSAGKKRYGVGGVIEKQTEEYSEALKKAGYSDEERKKMIDGTKRTVRTLAIIGGVSLAVVGGIAAYRYIDSHKDSILTPNVLLQTVHSDPVSERLAPGNPFYAAFRKSDKLIYSSGVFGHIGPSSQITEFKLGDTVKVASRHSQEKVFRELIRSDADYRKYYSLSGNEKGSDFKDAFIKASYDLVRRGEIPDKMHKKFYNALKSKGYGGLIDIEDSVREGRWTAKPTILFDETMKIVQSSTKAGTEHYAKSGSRFTKAALASTLSSMVVNNNLLKNFGLIGGAGLAGAYSVTKNKTEKVKSATKMADGYLMRHPNSNKSREQLIKEYINVL